MKKSKYQKEGKMKSFLEWRKEKSKKADKVKEAMSFLSQNAVSYEQVKKKMKISRKDYQEACQAMFLNPS